MSIYQHKNTTNTIKALPTQKHTTAAHITVGTAFFITMPTPASVFPLTLRARTDKNCVSHLVLASSIDTWRRSLEVLVGKNIGSGTWHQENGRKIPGPPSDFLEQKV